MAALRGTKPLWATETGYFNRSSTDNRLVPESVSAKYIPRLFGEYFNRGIPRTYLYELADQGPSTTAREENFGLLRFDLSEKPAFTAMKNLIDLLEEPGQSDFPAGTLSYTLTASTSVHQTLLQKSSGTYYLMLWNEVLGYDSVGKIDLNVADVAATLALPGTFDVRVYEPNASPGALATHSSISSLNLAIPDQMMVLELTAVPEPASLGVIAAGAILFTARRRQK
jgi:hypothetical protein